MKKIPISLIIDDPAPGLLVYYAHVDSHTLRDGRPIPKAVPNSFLTAFCEVMEHYGIRGKFSVVPMPAGCGDIVNGIDGVEPGVIQEWLELVRSRVSRYFSICPEVLTHAQAVDIATGALLEENEAEWSQKQDEKSLTPYIAKALSLHKAAGLEPTGVTSPWNFAQRVEADYATAVANAFDQVYGKKESWYFLHCLGDRQGTKPWLELEKDGRRVVSIPATTDDYIWQTMDTTETSDAYVSSVADLLLTEDGRTGRIVDVLESGGWPIVLTHWQSLFSNGAETGLRVLAKVAERVEKHLSDRVEWMDTEGLMRLVLEMPGEFHRPGNV